MPISFWCDCGRHLEVKEDYEGRRTTCPECGADLLVPSPAMASRMAETRGFVAAKTSGKAVASLVLGLTSFCGWLFTSIPAFVLGSMALAEIRRSRGTIRGRTPAIMGICFGLMGTMFVSIIVIAPMVLYREAAILRSKCAGNLNIVGAALKRYQENNNHFPVPAIIDNAGKPLLSWRVELLREIDPGLYGTFKLDEPWNSPHNMALLPRMPRIYSCPADTKAAADLTRYRVVVGPSGNPGPHAAFEQKRGVPIAEFTDGLTQTWLVVEAEEAVPWTMPDELLYRPAPWFPPPRDDQRDASKETPLPVLGSRHPGGFHAMRADGTVRFISRGATMNLIRARLTRDGKDGDR